MEKLKVLELVDSFYPRIDGAINVVKNYCVQLNKVTDCTLAAPKAAKKEGYVDNEEFKVIRCASTIAPEGYRLAQPDFDAKFTEQIENGGYELIHSHTPFNLGKFAIKTGKKLKVPVIVTLHTKYYDDFLRSTKSKVLSTLYLKYVMEVYKKADSVWTVTNASKEILRSYGYKGKVEVVRNGTDFVYPDNAKELIEKVNKEHNLHGQENVFLFVGRMAMYKGLKFICNVLKVLKDKNKDFKMLFVGGGFDLDELKNYAQKLDITDKCIFTDEIKDRALLQAYYLRSDLFFFPSTFDTSGIVTIEAAAHKKASILIEGSCSAEMTVNGENGFTCPEDENAFADKLTYLCDNPQIYKEVGENAYKTIYRTWDDVVKEVVEKYGQVLKAYERKQKARERAKKLYKLKKQQKRKAI